MAASATYLERYLAGAHKPVWAELVALGERVYEEPLYADAWAVARETMRRVRTNLDLLIPRLRAAGYHFGQRLVEGLNGQPLDDLESAEVAPPVRSLPQLDTPASYRGTRAHGRRHATGATCLLRGGGRRELHWPAA
jgi:hypothetical protein